MSKSRTPQSPQRPGRQTGKWKNGETIASVMTKEEAYQEVLYALVATFDRLAERLDDSELLEEQTEIAGAMGQLGTAIALHKMNDTLHKIEQAMPDSAFIIEALTGAGETVSSAIEQLADAVGTTQENEE